MGRGEHKQEWLFTGRCWMYTGMLLIAVESKCFSRTLPHRMENTKIPSKMETREIFLHIRIFTNGLAIMYFMTGKSYTILKQLASVNH